MDQLIMLSGAVALLLWGIRMVRTGAERLFGSRINSYFRAFTKHRHSSFSLGFSTTLILQSSTATLLMAAGFFSSGALTLLATLAIVLGAEVGSSLLPLILHVAIKEVGPFFLISGYLFFTLSSGRQGKHLGRIQLGIGMILLALSLIGSAQQEISGLFPLINNLATDDPVLTLLLMALFCWLLHSSVAAVLLISSMAAQSALSLDNGLWLILGVHLGAALPALSSGWSQGEAVKKIVISNLGFRLTAFGIGLIAYHWLLHSGYKPQLSATTTIALFYFATNALNSLILLLCLPPIARHVNRLRFEVAPGVEANSSLPIYLEPGDKANPPRALANASNESFRAADITYQMLSNTLQAFQDQELIKEIVLLDDHLDALHRETTLYLTSIHKDKNTEQSNQQLHSIFSYFTNLEHVGDIVSRSTMLLAKRKQKKSLEFSAEGEAELQYLHEKLLVIFKLSQAVFASNDPQLAKELIQAKRTFRQQLISARQHHVNRLQEGNGASIASSQIHLDILRDFRSISSYLSMVAYPAVKRDDLTASSP
ncbi:Na/Pi cotransporter family protein [Ketobacter sp. MCCC 1A13808]|uniref:Na/Pi cotransporter family protein n=1 Tax=Ketobacter sp. MCCC 1A13808 TaxID=2602738 RepID=UPI000F2B6356|nr:Na/Pi cotransporter family protein [Ketobacter sp. MCCC 1A13808]MVF14489.1 Na/Pi cotransporter family protein [Ketobacter sp. MCCC 1A13808]RLP55041.1 MAG: Na/Pi cotransporter family protein [Ketobacter sp.]